jgi:hypothetical protein
LTSRRRLNLCLIRSGSCSTRRCGRPPRLDASRRPDETPATPLRTDIGSYPIGYAARPGARPADLRRHRKLSAEPQRAEVPLGCRRDLVGLMAGVPRTAARLPHPPKSAALGQRTKSLRSSPLRGVVSREACNKPRG